MFVGARESRRGEAKGREKKRIILEVNERRILLYSGETLLCVAPRTQSDKRMEYSSSSHTELRSETKKSINICVFDIFMVRGQGELRL